LLAEQPGTYDFIVINDDLNKAYDSLKNYLEKVCGNFTGFIGLNTIQ